MAFFKVTFSRWVNSDEPAMEAASSAEELTAYKNTMSEFVVKAKDIKEARAYAKTFEGIETHAFEGLATVKSLVEIPLSEAIDLDRLAIYERYRHSR